MPIRRLVPLAVLAAGLAIGVPQGVRAQGDPADLAFWQSIQSSTNPAEYQAYLEAFPNGRFTALARLRARGAAPAPGPVPAPLPAPDPDLDPVSEKIIVTPPTGRVGQTMAFTCQDFPETSSQDLVVVVPAGSPDIDPTRAREETKILWTGYAVNCKGGGTLKGGPFAPGRYEARFVTKLYNNEGRYEIRTRSPFSIR